MKETVSNTPYVLASPTEKQRWSCVATKASISKRNLDIIHGNKPKPQARKKQKKEVAESSIIQKKAAAVSTTITSISSEKAVQSNSSRRRLIVDDDHEDLSQATPAGSKLQAVQSSRICHIQ